MATCFRETSTPSTELFDRYLRVLGVGKAPPSVEQLTAIVRAHLIRVPFENVSKLVDRGQGRRTLPDLATYLERIERYNLGGTCYPNNYYLYLLLRHVGFDVALCAADMNKPDVHMVSRATVGTREYLVDVGYGAPFYGPLPRDSAENHVISFGAERYVLRPRDGDGRSGVEHHRDGGRIHGYLMKPEPRRIEEFSQVVDASFDDSANFMNCVRLVRFEPGRSLALHNLTLVESTPDTVEIRELRGREELLAVIEAQFGVAREAVEEEIRAVPLEGGATPLEVVE